jgi:hypothetical protein
MELRFTLAGGGSLFAPEQADDSERSRFDERALAPT